MSDTLLPVTKIATPDAAVAGAVVRTGHVPPGSAIGRSVARAMAVRFPLLPPPAALLEIAVLFGLIIGLGWLTGQDMADLRPHPFWVPVLLLSLQYGTVSGLLAAGIATAFTGLGQLPEQVVGETYFVYFLRIWIEPILWISSAVLLGQFRMRQIADKIELARQVEELAGQRTALAAYSGKLRQRCEALERRLAGRQEPDSLLMLQVIGRARVAGAAGLSAAFSEVMATVLPGSEASLYVCEQHQLRRALMAPLPGDGLPFDAAPKLQATHPLFQAVVMRGEGASVLTAAGEAALAGQGIAAVPIRSDQGAVIGMIKVEVMDSQLLGPSTIGVLAAVAGALAGPLQAVLLAQDILPGSGGMPISPALLPAPLNSTPRSDRSGSDRSGNDASGNDVSGNGVSGNGAVAQPGGRIWRHVARRMPAGLMGRR